MRRRATYGQRKRFTLAPGLAALIGLVLLLQPLACRRSAPPEPLDKAATATPTATVSPPSKSWRVWDPKVPIIDSHVHIVPTEAGIRRALEVFARAGIGKFAIKSAGTVGSPKYQAALAMNKLLGKRMRGFVNIDWRGIDDERFIAREVARLEQAKRDGMVGVKIFKALGLGVRTADGRLLAVDSPLLAPFFDRCGQLGLIVAWHVADPVAVFQPVTPDNERYDELKLADNWSFYGKDFPSHDALIAARDRVIARHPNTLFLLIHLANFPENITYVDQLLDRYPNVFVDTAARLAEIGRHESAEVHRFFVKHQDRILFGSDFISGARGQMHLGSVSRSPPTVAAAVRFYQRHWRYFETKERQLPHPTTIQGRWRIDGIGLPLKVLRKLYVTNAEKLIFQRDHPLLRRPAK